MNRNTINIDTLKQKVHSLVHQGFEDQMNDDFQLLVEAEKAIHNYLCLFPNDIEALMLLALTVRLIPLADDPQSIEALRSLLRLDPSNYKALLILTYMEDMYCGIQPDTINALEQFQIDDFDIQSMIEIAKARYYFAESPRKYVLSLKKSINLSQKYVWSFIFLGRYYCEMGDNKLGHEYIKKGLGNVRNCHYDAKAALDPDRFISEYITGVHMSRANKELNTTRLSEEEYEDA